jgi:hypothetical protein
MRKTFNVKADVSYPEAGNELRVRVAFNDPSGRPSQLVTNADTPELIQLFAKPFISVVIEQNEDGAYRLIGLNGSSIPPEDGMNDDFSLTPAAEDAFGKFLN